MAARCAPRAMKVTSAPAFASAAPNPPPTPPAPTTATRMGFSPRLSKCNPDEREATSRAFVFAVRAGWLRLISKPVIGRTRRANPAARRRWRHSLKAGSDLEPLSDEEGTRYMGKFAKELIESL